MLEWLHVTEFRRCMYYSQLFVSTISSSAELCGGAVQPACLALTWPSEGVRLTSVRTHVQKCKSIYNMFMRPVSVQGEGGRSPPHGAGCAQAHRTAQLQAKIQACSESAAHHQGKHELTPLYASDTLPSWTREPTAPASSSEKPAYHANPCFLVGKLCTCQCERTSSIHFGIWTRQVLRCRSAYQPLKSLAERAAATASRQMY